MSGLWQCPNSWCHAVAVTVTLQEGGLYHGKCHACGETWQFDEDDAKWEEAEQHRMDQVMNEGPEDE